MNHDDALPQRWQSKPFFFRLREHVAATAAIIEMCAADWGVLRETEPLA